MGRNRKSAGIRRGESVLLLQASMLSSAFPRLGRALPAVLKDARKQLAEADGDSDGRLTREEFLAAGPLWFQRTTQEYLELQAQLTAPPDPKGGKGSKPAAKAGGKMEPKIKQAKGALVDFVALDAQAMDRYNTSATLKELLFDAFAQPGAEGPLLVIEDFLLRFAAATELADGVRRAAAVVSDEARLSGPDLARLASSDLAEAVQQEAERVSKAVASEQGVDDSTGLVGVEELITSQAGSAFLRDYLGRFERPTFVDAVNSALHIAEQRVDSEEAAHSEPAPESEQ